MAGDRDRDLAGTAASAAVPQRGVLPYLTGLLQPWQRILVGLVGLALLPVMFIPILPVWRIGLVAPQYREGLQMLIFANELQGDIDRINILNHYIGMQEISTTGFPEFGYMPWVLTLFGGVALLAALVGRRWLALLGWLGFSVFGTIMMMHFATWLEDYGTNLDPKAALDFGAFTPKLLGTTVRGNFIIKSFPHIGGYILLAAGILAPAIVFVDLWMARGRRGMAWGTSSMALILALGLAVPGTARAVDFISYREAPEVSPLQVMLDQAGTGDVLRFPDGVHLGQLVVDRTVTLQGTPQCILDGEGTGCVLVLRAPGITLRGFTVRNSGHELLLDDAGILVDEADDAVLEDLRLVDNNHGVYVRNSRNPAIRGCRLDGRRGRVHEENHGNGIHLWHARNARIVGNRIVGHRDGIYLSFAEEAMVEDNLVYEQDRFGFHSMYSQRNTIRQNTFGRNTAGVALMFSNRMLMEGNRFLHNRGHRTYGLLLRDCSDSRFVYNRFENNTIGLFLDGSNRNRFETNLFAENGWGVIAYSSSEDNEFTRNAFLDNDYQVSLDMRRTRNRLTDGNTGNYWSDCRPYDLDGDGAGDAPYCPVGLFAFVSKQYPDLTVFSGSPAVLALDIAQRSLPALQLTDLVDPRPQLVPEVLPPFRGPDLPAPSRETAPRRGSLALAAAMAMMGGGALLWRGGVS